MKVLMLGWELPPYNSGGLGVACHQLCKVLAKKDVDIEFVLPYHAEHNIDFMQVTAARPQGVADIVRSGIAYDSYKYLFTDGQEEWVGIFEQQQRYEAAVAQLAPAKTFDIVHAHDWLTFRAALRVQEQSNCPLILHVHSVERDRAGGRDGNPLVSEIEATAMVLADKIIAVSQQTKNAIMRDYAIPDNKIEVIHNSVDKVSFADLESDNTYRYLSALHDHGYKIICNVGRLTTQKGLPSLLRAAQKVVQYEPKTIFLIVGDGEQYIELVEQAAELGIAQNAIFTGFQRDKRWRDAFKIADLFVMPSVSEPFGLTPLEAIGYGTPSLISKQSGVGEVLTHCLKVDFWDIDEMANQIVAVIQNQPLRDELRTNILREYNQLSWDKSIDKLLGIYHKHLSGVSA